MRRFLFFISFVLLAATSTPGAELPSSFLQAGKTQKLANPLNDLLDEAQRAIDKNDFAAAIPPLQRFLAEKPDVAFAHSQLGYVFTALKKIGEARIEYERAVALDPKMSETWLNLGLLLMNSDPPAAVNAFEKAVELLPAQSRPRFLLGAAQERAGDLHGAIASLEGAAGLDPKDAETLIRLGSLYLRQKQYPQGESKFRAALALEPKQPAALQGLAQSMDAQNESQAADAYRAYLDVQPEDEGARERLIHSLMAKKQYQEALAELDKSEASRPATVATLKLRADIQIAQENYDDAIVTLRRAVELRPGDSSLRGELGRMYLQKRDFPNAESELRAAIEIDANNLTYWKDLSSAYYLAGNCPATLGTLDVIAKNEPPGAATWFVRALCYDRLRQTSQALAAYQKFLELDHNQHPDQVWQAQQRSKVLQKKQQKR